MGSVLREGLLLDADDSGFGHPLSGFHRFKQSLLGAPLGSFCILGIGGRRGYGVGAACGLPEQQGQLALGLGNGSPCGQHFFSITRVISS